MRDAELPTCAVRFHYDGWNRRFDERLRIGSHRLRNVAISQQALDQVLERQLARDLGSGAVSGGWAGGGEAAANMLRAAMRRVTVEVQEDTYDGAVPIKLVSQHALIKAVRRAELPLSIAEIGVLAEAFKSKWPATGGTTMRDVDYDAVVHFLTK